MSPPADVDLLLHYTHERSESAFRELVNRHLDFVYSAALRQTHGRAVLAEDVSQAVFIELARKAPSLTSHPSVRGWLYLCTRYVAAKTLRAEYRRLARETAAQAMNELNAPPVLDGDAIRPVLDDILYHLKDRDREAIFLRYFDKLSLADLGTRLGISEDAARRRVERILERLRSLLARRGITSSASALGLALTTEGMKAAPANLAVGITHATVAAVSGSSVGVGSILALLKTVALSTTFVAVVGLASVAAGGIGLYFNRQARQQELVGRSNAAAIAAATARLEQIKQQRTLARTSGSSTHLLATPVGTPLPPALAAQIARDLDTNYWREQQKRAQIVLLSSAFFKAHGVSVETQQQLFTLYSKTLAEFDDLLEVAHLAGVDIKSDADLLGEAKRLVAQMDGSAAQLLGSDTFDALKSYSNTLNAAGPNGRQQGEALWVTKEVAGVAFASGTSMTADDRDQLSQLIVKYTPNYQAGDDNGPTTLNWDGIIGEAQQSLPAAQVAALKSFRAASTVWALKDQAATAQGGTR